MTRARLAPPRIYVIADVKTLAPISLADGAEALAQAGVLWIQLRAKPAGLLSARDLYAEVECVCRRLEGSATELWIDDRADLAALFAPRISGLHLGQADLPPAAARRAVGDSLPIGLSTHDEEQVLAADREAEVDAVAVGPVFPTASKERPDPVVGLSFVRRAREATAKPLIAIGGITTENVTSLLEAGADCAAILGAVCQGRSAAEISRRARAFLAATEGA